MKGFAAAYPALFHHPLLMWYGVPAVKPAEALFPLIAHDDTLTSGEHHFHRGDPRALLDICCHLSQVLHKFAALCIAARLESELQLFEDDGAKSEDPTFPNTTFPDGVGIPPLYLARSELEHTVLGGHTTFFDFTRPPNVE
eukprot:gene1404-biopygen5150